MIEALLHIANLQAQLGVLQLSLIEEQETPASLEKAARMTQTLEDTSAHLKKHLLTWAETMRNEIEAQELITSILLEEPEG